MPRIAMLWRQERVVLPMKRFLILICIAVMLTVTFAPMAESEDKDDTTTVVLLGDMMFDLTTGDMIQSQGASYPFEAMFSYLNDSDLTFGNLESPISDRGKAEPGKYCTFCAKPATVDCLKYAGVDVVSLANNHCLDYGPDALNDTLYYLDNAKILHPGIWYGDKVQNASLPRPDIITVNGIRFGFLSYTENVSTAWQGAPGHAGPLPNSESVMFSDIKYSDPLVDVLVVSIHWRKWPQYTTAPFSEDRELCHSIIDWGADVIVGHGPHVVHEIEGYHGGVIFYSIGNSAMVNEDPANDPHMLAQKSFIVRLTLDGGTIKDFTLVPIVLQAHRFIPWGTPQTWAVSDTLKVGWSDYDRMFSKDVLNVTTNASHRNHWFIFRSSDPWYYKALSIFVFVSSVAVLVFIFYSVFRKKGKPLFIDWRNEVATGNNQSVPDAHPARQEKGPKGKHMPPNKGGAKGPRANK